MAGRRLDMRIAIVRSVALGALLCVAVFPRPAAADPIVITGGSIGLASPSSGIDWEGFMLIGADSSFSGVATGGVGAVPAGGSATLSGVANLTSSIPFPLATQQVVQGTPYLAFVNGTVTFSAQPFAVPPASAAGTGFAFSTPFTASGHISGAASLNGPTVFSVDLEGSGTATVRGNVVDPSQPFYFPLFVNYDFAAASPSLAPTPEPSSFAFLLAAGLAGAWWLRRRAVFA